EVLLERYVSRDRQLVAEPLRSLGVTPLRGVELPAGSYRLRLIHPACEEVRYPLTLGRGEHWDGIPPGEDDPLPIVLPPRGSLGTDDCYAPAGWFLAVGDPDAPDGLPRRRIWVDAVIVRRFPVTTAEYFAFLDALASEDPARAERAAPASL